MCANKATMETKYIDPKSMLGNINEKIAATATGNSIHGNTSHLVLLICDTINRHCNNESLKFINFDNNFDKINVDKIRFF